METKKINSDKLLKTVVIGMIKGGLTGAIIGGYESVVTGALVMGILQGVYLSVENTYE